MWRPSVRGSLESTIESVVESRATRRRVALERSIVPLIGLETAEIRIRRNETRTPGARDPDPTFPTDRRDERAGVVRATPTRDWRERERERERERRERMGKKEGAGRRRLATGSVGERLDALRDLLTVSIRVSFGPSIISRPSSVRFGNDRWCSEEPKRLRDSCELSIAQSPNTVSTTFKIQRNFPRVRSDAERDATGGALPPVVERLPTPIRVSRFRTKSIEEVSSRFPVSPMWRRWRARAAKRADETLESIEKRLAVAFELSIDQSLLVSSLSLSLSLKIHATRLPNRSRRRKSAGSSACAAPTASPHPRAWWRVSGGGPGGSEHPTRALSLSLSLSPVCECDRLCACSSPLVRCCE